MKDKLKSWVLDYLKSIQLPARRRKIKIRSIEEYLIQKIRNPIHYQEENGYFYLAQIMNELTMEKVVAPIKKSGLNGRRPSLATEWWLEKAIVEKQWSDMQILAVSDRLNLTKYRVHPEWQTDMEWERIHCIYEFIKHIDHHTWVTREERSFQLFGEEKFLANEGANLLQRLQLSLDDLKARVYGEPFAFWLAPKADLRNAETALIVENQSFYHTCRLLMNHGKDIIGIKPDLLVYGEGKKIEKSLTFLHDITLSKDLSIYYAGDLDPEGWGIYVRLKDTYPDAGIQLAVSIYEELLNLKRTNQTTTNQNENPAYLIRVMREFEQQGRSGLAAMVKHLWENKLRVPQEALSLETIERLKE